MARPDSKDVDERITTLANTGWRIEIHTMRKPGWMTGIITCQIMHPSIFGDQAVPLWHRGEGISVAIALSNAIDEVARGYFGYKPEEGEEDWE
jgi:hypothetical protein